MKAKGAFHNIGVFLKKNILDRISVLLFAVSFLFSCKKSEYKDYKCKKNCLDIQILGSLADSSNTSSNLRSNVLYRILFLQHSGGWIEFNETKPLLIEEGHTNSEGKINTIVSCNKDDLQGDYGIYIRFYENDKIAFCKNPPLFTIYDVPQNNSAAFTLDVYPK